MSVMMQMVWVLMAMVIILNDANYLDSRCYPRCSPCNDDNGHVMMVLKPGDSYAVLVM